MPSFDQLQLHTPRLLLRPVQEGDAAELFAIFSDPEVMRYWVSGPWATIDTAHDLIARDAQALAQGLHLRLGLETIEDGRLIGTCSLFNLVESSRRAELGYGLARSAWGQGYMREALSALLAYGFVELDLHRIEAELDPRNVASARSLERQGFQREGVLRERWIVNGEIQDSYLYGLLRHEWLAIAAGTQATLA